MNVPDLGGPSAHAPSNPVIRHEVRDIDLPLILWTAGGLIVLVLVIQLVVWVFFEQQKRDVNAGPVSANPQAVADSKIGLVDRLQEVSRQGPILEGLEPVKSGSPYLHYGPPVEQFAREIRPQDLQADRQPALQGYRFDPTRNAYAIPIKEAIDLLADNAKLRTRYLPSGTGEVSHGMPLPSKSNSGRPPEERRP